MAMNLPLQPVGGVHVVPDISTPTFFTPSKVYESFDYFLQEGSGSSLALSNDASIEFKPPRNLSRRNSELNVAQKFNKQFGADDSLLNANFGIMTEQDSKVPVKYENCEDDLSVDVADLMAYAPAPSDMTTEESLSMSEDDDEEEEDALTNQASMNDYIPRNASPVKEETTIRASNSISKPHPSRSNTLNNTSSSAPTSTSRVGKTTSNLRSKSRPKTKEEIEAKKERMRLRQEKNRQAAKKCRERKQQYYAELENEVKTLRSENASLKEQLNAIRKELLSIKPKHQAGWQ